MPWQTPLLLTCAQPSYVNTKVVAPTLPPPFPPAHLSALSVSDVYRNRERASVSESDNLVTPLLGFGSVALADLQPSVRPSVRSADSINAAAEKVVDVSCCSVCIVCRTGSYLPDAETLRQLSRVVRCRRNSYEKHPSTLARVFVLLRWEIVKQLQKKTEVARHFYEEY